MTLQRNNYEVLGVPPKASTDEIKKKYRELARKFHPDIAKDKVMGQKIFSQINQAYHILGDPDRRAQYDASLAADSLQRSATPRNGAQNGASSAQQTSKPVSAQDSANITRLIGEAETALLQNNVGKVSQICEKVIEIDPRNQKAHAMLGDALSSMGKSQEAIAAYRRALQIAPSFAIQAKLDRLQGSRPAPAPNGAAATRPMPPMSPSPSRNGGAVAPPQNAQEAARSDKSIGGLFSRFLGKK